MTHPDQQACEEHGADSYRGGDGTMMCTRCGKPSYGETAEDVVNGEPVNCSSHGKRTWVDNQGRQRCNSCSGILGPAKVESAVLFAGKGTEDRPLTALLAIQRGIEEQNDRLRKIWWALFAIWAPIILIFASLWFGWFEFDFVIGPAG